MQERKDRWSVGAWMSPNPKVISPQTSARSAFFTMRRKGFRHLLVVDDGGDLAGIVTDRDLRRPDLTDEPDGWHETYRLDDGYEVRHLMTTDLVTALSREPLEKALSRLLERKVGALPVVDKLGKPIGILTTYDVLRAFDAVLDENGTALRGELDELEAVAAE